MTYFKITFDKKQICVIIIIGNGETTNVVCHDENCENASTMGKITDAFLLFYFCLLIITAIAIIKANAMIVTATNAVKSKYIVTVNASSTIRLTSSYVGGKPHLLILISYRQEYTTLLAKCQV